MRFEKILLAVFVTCSAAHAYVYEFQDNISVSGQTSEEERYVFPPEGPPPGNVQPLCTLVSFVDAFLSTTPYENEGVIGASGVVAEPGGLYSNVIPLSVGDVVGPASNWKAGGVIYGYSEAQQVGDPAFLAPQGAYVGFEVPDTNNQVHYGWLLVHYDQPAGTYFGTLELEEVAYETDPGVPITIAPEPTAGLVGLCLVIAADRRLGRRRRE